MIKRLLLKIRALLQHLEQNENMNHHHHQNPTPKRFVLFSFQDLSPPPGFQVYLVDIVTGDLDLGAREMDFRTFLMLKIVRLSQNLQYHWGYFLLARNK